MKNRELQRPRVLFSPALARFLFPLSLRSRQHAYERRKTKEASAFQKVKVSEREGTSWGSV